MDYSVTSSMASGTNAMSPQSQKRPASAGALYPTHTGTTRQSSPQSPWQSATAGTDVDEEVLRDLSRVPSVSELLAGVTKRSASTPGLANASVVGTASGTVKLGLL